VTCKHWRDCGIPGGGCCAEGHNGGKPSLGVCGVCEHHTEPRPGLVDYIRAVPHVVQAVLADGNSPMALARLEICRGCSNWESGTCRLCGCLTGLKVRLKSQACPMGKWLPEG
jgi:hypothetical protein